MAKKVPPMKELDPDLANFIRALAREAARQDHDAKFTGNKKPPAGPEPRPAKSGTKVNLVRTVPDGKGGFTRQPVERREKNEQWRLIKDHHQEAAEIWKTGRHDEFGISKILGMRFPKKSPKP